MAGHSKWANIKHRKAAQDKKRGKIFTKLIKEISVAARASSDPNSPRLRAAIDNALSNNMTRDTIDKAVKRAQGAAESDKLNEIRYEGYGPAGAAIMVDSLTDNHKRTVAEVRFAFSKHGGSLGTDGSVSYLFDRVGQIIFAPGANEDKIMEVALEAGADDIISADDNSIEILCAADDLMVVKDALDNAGLKAVNAEVCMRPQTTVSLSGEDAEKYLKLFDALDDLDDVQNVYSNVELD